MRGRIILAPAPLATLLALMILSAGGATCARRTTLPLYPAPPVVLQETPTIESLASIINRTDTITKLQGNAATVEVLSMPSLPRLQATVAIERPRRIRIQASIPLLPGSGLDLGSNDQQYWMRVPEAAGGTLYHALHDAPKSSGQPELLSVEPMWLIDSLGLGRIDLNVPHTQPTRLPDGRWEIRSAAQVSGEVGQRVLWLDGQTGVITHQYLLGGDGQVRARSESSQFEYFPQQQFTLPHRVRLWLMIDSQPLELQIDVGDWIVNAFLTDDPTLFTLPSVASDRQINLSQPPPLATRFPRAATPAGYAPTRAAPLLLRGTDR